MNETTPTHKQRMMARNALMMRRLGAVALIVAAAGCEDASQRDGLQPPGVASASSSITTDETAGIRVHLVERDDAEMLAAIAKARETADEARTRWLASPESARMRWAIKWAAPNELDETDDESEQSVEYVWVLPLHWSPFRVEGILASEPVEPLACRAREGDLVSFAIEELADWVYFAADGTLEGGFTAAVIAAREGRSAFP